MPETNQVRLIRQRIDEAWTEAEAQLAKCRVLHARSGQLVRRSRALRGHHNQRVIATNRTGHRGPTLPPLGRRATVLLGEDVPDIRLAMTILFQRRGHEVFSVGDGASVMGAALRVLPDVILLNLPGTEALAVCRQLRKEPRTARVAIIVLSADIRPSQADAHAVGADDYVTKPFYNDDLIARTEALVAPGPAGLGRFPAVSAGLPSGTPVS